MFVHVSFIGLPDSICFTPTANVSCQQALIRNHKRFPLLGTDASYANCSLTSGLYFYKSLFFFFFFFLACTTAA